MGEMPSPATWDEALGLLRGLWEEVERWRAEAAELQEANARLTERVADLEARLQQNSTNSSRPPSSDPPGTPAPSPRPPSGRRRGAQPGHPAHQRALVPPEQVDRVVAHWPARCRHCQAPLSAVPGWAVGEPVRHQVTELPPVRAEVTEHQLHRVRCPDCGGETRASLPPAVPAGAFGPRLQAAVALLSGRYRLSRREVAGVCGDLLGAPLAVGSVDGLCQATAAALAEPVAELEAAVRAAPVAHADETSWRQAGQRQWLWVVTTSLLTVFTVAASRSRGVIQGLLGEDFGGRLVTDRYSAYGWLPLEQRQVCWAHLRRDFAALLTGGPSAAELGLALLDLTDQIFAAWHHARAEPAHPAARQRLSATLAPLQAELRALLEAGQQQRAAKPAGLSRSLLQVWPALWTFIQVPGVEPTNNAAERALRPAVLWRKGSFGTQSDRGNQFVARLLSVAATCRQQQRPLLAYLTAVCTAAQFGQPSPSLLPAPALALPQAA
jgi:transposase